MGGNIHVIDVVGGSLYFKVLNGNKGELIWDFVSVLLKLHGLKAKHFCDFYYDRRNKF